jgi:hypothetical protein
VSVRVVGPPHSETEHAGDALLTDLQPPGTLPCVDHVRLAVVVPVDRSPDEPAAAVVREPGIQRHRAAEGVLQAVLGLLRPRSKRLTAPM